jgi:Asp/Glu/hydantoin racemase
MLNIYGMILNEQTSTEAFIPGFTAIYCHAKPLLAALKDQKASPIVGTGEDEPVLESSGSDKLMAS